MVPFEPIWYQKDKGGTSASGTTATTSAPPPPIQRYRPYMYHPDGTHTIGMVLLPGVIPMGRYHRALKLKQLWEHHPQLPTTEKRIYIFMRTIITT